jgi:hypothetical protein
MPESRAIPDLPEPSAELMLLLALVQALVNDMPRRKRDRLLHGISDALGMQEASYNILRFRPRSQDAKVFAAMRSAQAWFRQALGALSRM